MAIAVSLVLLGVSAGKNSTTFTQTEQAHYNAQTCIERVLRSLQMNPGYSGDETFVFTEGSCTVLPVEASGDERTVCAEGHHKGNVRRLELKMRVVYPDILIDEWQEKYAFTLCGTP